MSFVVPERERWALPPLLRERAAELGARPFLSFGVDDATATYAEMDERTDRLAAGLAALGVAARRGRAADARQPARVRRSAGSRSASSAPRTCPSTSTTAATSSSTWRTRRRRGSWCSRTACVETVAASLPRLPQLTHADRRGRSARRRCRASTCAPSATSCSTPSRPPTDDRPGRHRLDPCSRPAPPVRSKGALIPHANLHLLSERNGELLGMGRDTVYRSELPLFHINAQMTVYGALISGARARLEERFSASRWLERVRASRRDAHVDARRDARVRARAAAIRGRP